MRRNLVLAGVLTMAVSCAAAPACVSGVYPHLAMFNDEGECGTGAVVPWAGSLWVVTYGPHCPVGSSDRLYQITPRLEQKIRPESVGGTPANRLLHRESGKLLIGTYLVDRDGMVTTVPIHTMPGRLTGAARHLTDPANKVYVTDMEEALYELDVNTLATRTLIRDGHNMGTFKGYFKKLGVNPPAGWDTAEDSDLFGYHGKGTCSGFGKVFYTNNGQYSPQAMKDPFTPAGCLAEWRPEEKQWHLIRTNQFTEVTTRDGVWGNEHPDTNPVWALGWDARSVILTVTADGKTWHDYRLPKGSHSYDGAHGWNTEWPRIRDVGRANLLGSMHGTFWDFPADFSPTSPRGIRPLSTYLKVIGDFCGWNGRVVFGCDDSAKSEFLNKRRAKGALKGPGRSQSNLWFVDPAALTTFGAPVGHGAVWSGDDVAAGAVSAPYLFAGYDRRWLWITAGSYDVQLDARGDGTWTTWKTLGAGGHDLSSAPEAEWVRLVAKESAARVSAVFHYTSVRAYAPGSPLTELAAAGARGNVIISRHRPEVLRLATSTNTCLELDAALALTHPASWEKDTAQHVLEDAPIPENVLVCDAASVLYVDDAGKRWRLPYGAERLRAATPQTARVCREVCTERDLFNAGGIFYELPARNAGGFAKIRPVSTHNLDVYDYASWRGLFVLSMQDGRLLAGVADDLWRLGTPVGTGGPWNRTSVKAGEVSDPYLVNGFADKTLALASDTTARVTLEADIDGTGHWVVAGTFDVKAGEPLVHRFPAAFSAYWVRTVSSAAAVVTAQFTCR